MAVNKMKGYKAFNGDMTCRDFQYEWGKEYELGEDEKLEMCSCGFHFCENPIDVFGYYLMSDDVIIGEVEAYGEIQQEGTKFCTDKIRIIKEFPREQLQALIFDSLNNTGNCNSGNCNSGDGNSGIFNTDEPKMRAFNKTCDVTRTEFMSSIDYSFYSLSDRIANKALYAEDYDRIKALPNFDAEIFKEITGLEVVDDE